VELHDFTTEEINLACRLCDCLADVVQRDSVEGHVLAGAAEVLRLALRARTIHDPLPGQRTLLG
jgi:hypothetical protein